MFAEKEKKQQSGTFAPPSKSGEKYPSDLRRTVQPPDSLQILQRSLGNQYLQSLSSTAGQSEGLLIRRACACGGSCGSIPKLQEHSSAHPFKFDSAIAFENTFAKMGCSRSCASCVQQEDNQQRLQPKLKIGAPNDKYEQEADRVADQVMRMPEPSVQRQEEEETGSEELEPQPMEEEEEEEEETLQTKPLAEQITPLVQRQTEPMEEEEEEETLQTKTTSGQPPTVSSSLHNRITALQGGGQPLPQSERAFFEPRFGADFSQVRIHTNSRAAETARAVNARAFTLGQDLVFGAGQYKPCKSAGRRLLAHELAHVVQQGGDSRLTASGNIQRSQISRPTATKPYFTYQLDSKRSLYSHLAIYYGIDNWKDIQAATPGKPKPTALSSGQQVRIPARHLPTGKVQTTGLRSGHVIKKGKHTVSFRWGNNRKANYIGKTNSGTAAKIGKGVPNNYNRAWIETSKLEKRADGVITELKARGRADSKKVYGYLPTANIKLGKKRVLKPHKQRELVTGSKPKKAAKPISKLKKTAKPILKVRSLQVERMERNVKAAKKLLRKKLNDRKKFIKKSLKMIGKNPIGKKAKKRRGDLQKDLKKSLKQIIKSRDSKYVLKIYRRVIIKTYKKVKAREKTLQKSQAAFRKYDTSFKDPKVISILKKKSFTVSELKALVAKESGDFMKKDTKGRIVGPAQIGAKECREVGHALKDRTDPKKFLLVAAKVLILKANRLESKSKQSNLPLPPVGSEEYKKFVYASYNAGANTIKTARKWTKRYKRDPNKWESVIRIDLVPKARYKTSGLHQGIEIELTKKKVVKSTKDKYTEITDYVRGILKRLSPRQP